MIRRRVMMFSTAILFGLTMGAISPTGTSEAVTGNYHMWYTPTTEPDNSNAYLVQSWHGCTFGECPSISLDWDDINTPLKAYDRAWAWAGTAGYHAYVSLSTGGPYYGCKFRLWADVYQAGTNTWLMSIGHIHVKQPQFGGNIFYYFSPNLAWNSAIQVGNLVTSSDGETCSWTGPHDHETHVTDAASGQHNALNFGTVGWYPTKHVDSWTREFWWY